MSNKQKFFSQLQNLYVGAKLDGKGGMANLLQFKCQYFEHIKPLIEAEIKKNFPDSSDNSLPELYEKLYTFFSSYLTDGGSIYFSDTPAYKNVYAKVYFDKEDTALFYKTKDLYYVKSQIMYQSVENLTFNHENKAIGIYFDFDATDYTPTNNNTKEKVLILFTGVKNQKLQFKVIEQSQITSQATDTSDEQLKDIAEAALYSIKKSNTQLFEESSSFYAINFNQNEKCRKSVLKFLAENGIETTEEMINQAINIYKKQNEVDFFIHKNAKGFLTEQFNMFIYNYLSNDMDSLLEQKRLDNIRKIKAIAFVAIDYIAKFEDELKAIWNKPKFVLNSNYVVTLDKLINKGLDISLLTNHTGINEQIKEWQDLGIVDEKFNINEITQSQDMFADSKYKYLPFDTKHFDIDVKYAILSLFDNFDEECDGVLIKSDNYQALNTIMPKYKEQATCIYIDPPYNTNATEIIYKNGYRNSSWISYINDRLLLGSKFLATNGVHVFTIDDAQIAESVLLINSIFDADNHLATVPIRNNPQGRSTVSGFSINHEYAIFHRRSKKLNSIGRLARTVEQLNRYREIDENNNKYLWENFRKTGTDSLRDDRPKQFYPLFVNIDGTIRVPKLIWQESSSSYELCDVPLSNELIVYPIDENKNERVWKWGIERCIYEMHHLKVSINENSVEIYRRQYLNEEGKLPGTWWDNSKYAAGSHGTDLLSNIFGKKKKFDFAKSFYAVMDCLQVAMIKRNNLTIDFFAGSGTTAHAVINLNRNDGQLRKYLLVEMGEHFYNVVLPRVKKLVFSEKWKNGNPQDSNGISQLVKYYELEQYEDVLDKAVYNCTDYNVANLAYDFSNNEKLAHDGLTIDYSDESNPIHYSFEKLYPDIDIWETISNFYGYKIKQYHSSKQVTYVTRDGREITLSKDKITFDSMPELKALIWW